MILQKRLQINGSGSRTVFRNPITGESRVTTITPATPPNASISPVETSTQRAIAHPNAQETADLQGAHSDSVNRAVSQGSPQLSRIFLAFRVPTSSPEHPIYDVALLRSWLAQVRAELATRTPDQAAQILNDYNRIQQMLIVLMEHDPSHQAQWWTQYEQSIRELIGNPANTPPAPGRLAGFNFPPQRRLYLLHHLANLSRYANRLCNQDTSTKTSRDNLFTDLYTQMKSICESELHFNTDSAARENPLYLVYLGINLETPLSEEHAALMQRQRARDFLTWFSAHDETWFEQNPPQGANAEVFNGLGPVGNWTYRTAYFLRHPERLMIERPGQAHPPHLSGEALEAQDLLSALHRLSVPTPAESAAVALNNTAFLALLGILIPVYTYSGQMQNASELTNFTQAVRTQIDLFPSKSLREILESLKTPAAGVQVHPDAQRVARFILETRNLTFRNLVDDLLRENQDTELAPLYGIHERDFLSPTGMRDAINNINAMPLLAERYGITQLDINNPHHQRCMEDLLIREVALRHYLGQSLDAIIPADAQPDWVEWWRNRANTISAEGVANQFVEHVARTYDQTRDAFSHLPYLSDETNLAHLTLSYWASFMLRADQLGFDLSPNSRSRLLHLNQRLQDWDNHSFTAALGETFTGNNILTMLGTALIYEFLEVLVVARGPGRLVAESGRMNLWGSVVTGGSAGTISAVGSTLAHHRWGGDHPLRFRDFGHDMGVNIAGQSTGLILYAAGQSFRNPFAAFAFSQAGRFGSAFAISEGDSYLTNHAWLNEHQRDVFYMSYGANALVHGAVRYGRYNWAARNAAGDPENPGWLARGTFGEPNIRRIQTTPSLRANDPELLTALQRSFWDPRALDDFLNDQAPSSPSTPPSLPSGRNPQVSVPNVPIEGVSVAVSGNRHINARNAANPEAGAVMPSDFDMEVWVDSQGKLWARDLSNTARPIRGVDHRNGQSEFVVIPNNGTNTKIQGGRIEVYAPGANPSTDRPIFQISITGNTPTPVPPAPQPAPFSGRPAPANPFQGGGIAPTRIAAPEPTRVGPRPRPVPGRAPNVQFPHRPTHFIAQFWGRFTEPFRLSRGQGLVSDIERTLPEGVDIDVTPPTTPGGLPQFDNHSTQPYVIRVQSRNGEWSPLANGRSTTGDTLQIFAPGTDPSRAGVHPLLEVQFSTSAGSPTMMGGGMGGLPGAPTGAPPTRPGAASAPVAPPSIVNPTIRFTRGAMTPDGPSTHVEVPSPGLNQTIVIDATHMAGPGLPQGLRVAVSADQFDGLAVRNQSTTGHQVVITTPAGEQMSLPAIPNRGGRTNNAHPVVKIYAPGVNINSADAVPLFEFEFTSGTAGRGQTLMGTAPAAGSLGIPDTIIRTAPEEQPAPARGPRERRDDDYRLPERPPVPEWARRSADDRIPDTLIRPAPEERHAPTQVAPVPPEAQRPSPDPYMRDDPFRLRSDGALHHPTPTPPAPRAWWNLWRFWD